MTFLSIKVIASYQSHGTMGLKTPSAEWPRSSLKPRASEIPSEAVSKVIKLRRLALPILCHVAMKRVPYVNLTGWVKCYCEYLLERKNPIILEVCSFWERMAAFQQANLVLALHSNNRNGPWAYCKPVGNLKIWGSAIYCMFLHLRCSQNQSSMHLARLRPPNPPSRQLLLSYQQDYMSLHTISNFKLETQLVGNLIRP